MTHAVECARARGADAPFSWPPSSTMIILLQLVADVDAQGTSFFPLSTSSAALERRTSNVALCTPWPWEYRNVSRSGNLGFASLANVDQKRFLERSSSQPADVMERGC